MSLILLNIAVTSVSLTCQGVGIDNSSVSAKTQP